MNFAIAPLPTSQLAEYLTQWYDAYENKQAYYKITSTIRTLPYLNSSDSYAEIGPLVDAIVKYNYPTDVTVGADFTVLIFDITYAYKEITALGFLTPKRVVEVRKHSDGTIDHVKFSDGDIYPRVPLSAFYGAQLFHTAYFSDKETAETALTQLLMMVPNGWDIDLTQLTHCQ